MEAKEDKGRSFMVVVKKIEKKMEVKMKEDKGVSWY